VLNFEPKNLKEAVNLFEKPEDEYFDANNSILETVVIIQNNGDEPIYIPNDKHKLLSLGTTSEQGITRFRVYSKKVGTAITYSSETDEKLCFMIYQICEETKIHFITYLNSYPISIPISNKNHDMASSLEIFLQIEAIFQINLKVIEKIQKIADQINVEESEHFETPLEYLRSSVKHLQLHINNFLVFMPIVIIATI
ncbi:915_t:CDS:2, partial [Gigaspora margarita]